MPRWITPLLIVLATLALVPFACVARARATRAEATRLHLFHDMDHQISFKSQQANDWFADGRAMRQPVSGTVARGSLQDDDHYFRGILAGGYANTFPGQVRVDAGLLERGRERYGIYCAPCHGLSGYGDGLVARRADRLQQGTWIPPSSFHVEPASTRTLGHLYNTITNGIRSMAGYGSQIEVRDRWAIVAYLKALQRSQRASRDDVPQGQRQALR